jgi:hypothetical protein
MKTNKVVSVEDYKIVSSFQTLRKTLLDDRFADRLEKPLAYWAMPNDRRLPLAFLGRTIKDLLETPFEELSATPGIGQKKISCLVKLLSRATKDHPPATPFGIADLADGRSRVAPADKPRRQHATHFDPSVVSEAHWTEWRETVNRHHFGHEKLGRLAPTLQTLPTVIWHTPLEFYLNYSVAEIRQLKTHGEKRVRVVLEVFHLIHQTVSASAPSEHLSVRMVPKFIEPLERWIHDVIARAEVPTADEVREKFSIPLLNQLRIDAGDNVFELSQGRLGIHGPAESVRHQAKRMGVTRARVYQLLEDCAKIMNVRWPEGQYLLAALSAKLNVVAKPEDDLKSFRSTLDLFFPDNHPLMDMDGDAHPEAAHPEAVASGQEEPSALAERV